VGDYCDNRGGLTAGRAVGYWNIDVVTAGNYELDLRRWPVESKLPLNAGYGPDFKRGQRGQRAVAAANLQIAGANYTLDSQPDDTHITFRVSLKAGRQHLSTRLLDAKDQTLCSAMYVKLTRLPESATVELTPESAREPKGVARSVAPVHNAIPPKPLKLAKDDILMADFEGQDFGDWIATGDAFKSGPTDTKGRIVGFQGQRVLDTFIANGSDKPTGTLTSPEFTIDRKRINFLTGGGKTRDKTCMNLLVDGKVVRTAVGTATKNSANRKILRWMSWDVSELQGKPARLQIVDDHSGGWGHIVVDHIYRSNGTPQSAE
jgi:hypothetical protein